MENKTLENTTQGVAEDDYHNQDLLIGCCLAIGGNLLISIALNLQKYTHLRNGEAGDKNHYTKDPLWWLGLILMGLGEVGNFAAYGFAPASLVAPLGTTTVIANMFIAVIFLKEKLRNEDIFGSTMAVVGAFLLVTFSTGEEAVWNAHQIIFALSQPIFLVYMSIEIAMLIACFVLKYKYKKTHVVILLLMTSLFASFTVISAKGVSSMIQLTFAGQNQLVYAIFWIMIILMILTALIQVKYLNQAMKGNDATVVVPINFVFFTISAILAGVIFYREFYGMGPLDILMFVFGCMMCFAGVFFISFGRATMLPPNFEEETEVKKEKMEEIDEEQNIPPADDSLNKEDVEKASKGKSQYKQRIVEILPTWLLTNFNIARVQPKGSEYGERNPYGDTIPLTQGTSSTDSSPAKSSHGLQGEEGGANVDPITSLIDSGEFEVNQRKSPELPPDGQTETKQATNGLGESEKGAVGGEAMSENIPNLSGKEKTYGTMDSRKFDLDSDENDSIIKH